MTSDSTRIGVIIPARNEEDSIGLVLDDIPKELNTYVVVVDNGSSDNTSNIAAEHGAVVLEEKITGYGRVMLKGIEYFNAHPVDIVVFLDGDYSDFPEEMNRLITPIIEDNYDMIVGTRLNPLYDKRSLSSHVVYGNKLVVMLMNLIHGTKYTDLGPFRAIRYDRLMQLNMVDQNYGWTVEMQVKTQQHAMKVKEVPLRYRTRIGKSKVSGTIKGSVFAGAKMLYMLPKLYLNNDSK